jgi:hypothetical protein
VNASIVPNGYNSFKCVVMDQNQGELDLQGKMMLMNESRWK